MQIGCCLPTNTFMPEFKNDIRVSLAYNVLCNGYRTIMGMGYDYMEATNGTLLDLSEKELSALAEQTASGDFGIRYVNCFLPGTIRVCVHREAAQAHAVETFRRLHKLGIRALVFGSGTSRNCPADMRRDEAVQRLKEMLRFCERVGGEYGIYTCLEPLQVRESNQINLVSEAVEWVRELDLPYLRITPDAFHMALADEDPEVLRGNIALVNHVHIAEAPERVPPGKDAGEYLPRFTKTLRALGYDGDITVECGYKDFVPELSAGLRYIKEVLL